MNCIPFVRQYDILNNKWGVYMSRGVPNKRYTPEFIFKNSIEHFKRELIEYLDYYNNQRINAKLKGLPPAIHRQQALSAA